MRLRGQRLISKNAVSEKLTSDMLGFPGCDPAEKEKWEGVRGEAMRGCRTSLPEEVLGLSWRSGAVSTDRQADLEAGRLCLLSICDGMATRLPSA